MKHLKVYESLDKVSLEIGDYVICREYTVFKELNEFISSNIGEYIAFIPDYDDSYVIRYNNIPKEMSKFFTIEARPGSNRDSEHERNMQFYDCRSMIFSEIIHWSEDREDLEIILNTNKYNI